ncbi:benzoate membrane transport protein [Caballeronia fortuita]|uniref:Benzoate membrane transport protein n=1 Tax=Caballeronia fortuita TaxID=1777138 RepID=A0A158A0T0_9BURK|nr:benzoate membrane transport protein [Caballeronia fortuita]
MTRDTAARESAWSVSAASAGLLAVIISYAGPLAILLLFAALPNAFVAVLAGLALLGAITANVVGLVQDEAHREASFIAFIATASNMSFLGLGSAFWGIVLGALAHLVLGRAKHAR